MSTGGSLLGVSVLELRTDNRQLDAGLAQAHQKAERAGSQMQASMDKRLQSVGSSMSRIGSTMSTHLTLPIVAGFGAAADAAVHFQQKMELVHTQAGDTQKAVGQLSGQVLNLAKSGQVAAGPNALADGLFRLEGAGLRGKQAMDALTASAQLAAIGNANVEDTAKTLAQTWFVGIKGAGNFRDTVAELNATVGAGDLRLQQLVDALGTGVLASAKEAGLSLQDVTGAMAVFGDETNNVSGWAAQFATSLHFLFDPSKKAADALGRIGIGASQLAQDMHKPNGLVVALKDLKSHLEALPGGEKGVQANQILGDILPGGRGRVLLVLLNQLDRLQAKEAQIAKTHGQFADNLAKTQDTAAFRIHAAWATIEADAIRFGDQVLPQLLKVGGAALGEADKVVSAFERLPKGVQDTIITGGLITAAIGPALKLMGIFTSGLGKLWEVAQITKGLVVGQGLAAFRGGGASSNVLSAVGRINGSRGPELPGSLANPIAVVVVGSAGGLGGGTLGAGTAAEEEAAAASTASRVRSALSTGLSRGMQGLAIGGIGYGLSQVVGAAVHGGVGRAIKDIGGDASIGAGLGAFFGPAGIAGGAMIGGLVGTVTHFINHDAQRQGKEWADKFLAPLPASVRDKYGKALSDAARNVTANKPIAAPNFAHNGNLPITPAQFNAYFNALYRQGKLAGQAFVDAFSTVKIKTLPAFLADASRQLDKLKGTARNEAASAMISYALSLEQHGQLPRGATDRIIAALESRYRGLGAFLNSQGKNNSATIAKTMKWDAAVANLTHAEQKVRSMFGLWATDPTINGGNVIDSFRSEMSQLEGIAKGTTGAAHDAAILEMKALKADAHDVLKRMVSDFQTQAGAMSDTIAHGPHNKRWADAVGQALKNLSTFTTGIGRLMAGGAVTTTQGAEAIYQALKSTITSFGGKPPSAPALEAAKVQANVIAGAVGATSSVSNLLGLHAVGGRVTTPTIIVGEEAPAHPEYVLATNPAYRNRNLGLWAQAGRALGVPGFAQGGVVGYGQLEGLWNQAGGPPQDAALMAAIAEAESGGSPTARNPSGASGLWQILGLPFAGNPFDPLTNARMAVAKFRSQGLGAWVTYTSGAYRRFLNGAVPASGGAGGSFGQITAPHVTGGGTVGLLAQSALNKIADAANAYVTAHMPLAGGLGPVGPTGGGFDPSQLANFDGHQVARWMIPELEWARQHGWGGTVTSGYRPPWEKVSGVFATAPQGQSEHRLDIYPGGAVDVSDYQTFAALARSYPGAEKLIQLGIDPLHFSGTGHKTGGIIGLAQGGQIPGRTLAHAARLPKTAAKAPKAKTRKFKGVPPLSIATPYINQKLARLNWLMTGSPGSGRGKSPVNSDIPALQELYQYGSQSDDLNQYTFLVTQDPVTGQPVAPYIDQGAVSARLAQLQQLFAWQLNIRHGLQEALGYIEPLLVHLRTQIAKRKAQIKILQARVRANLKTMTALQAVSGKGSKTQRAAVATKLRALRDINATIGGDRDKLGTGGQIGTLTSQIQKLGGYGDDLHTDRATMVGVSGIGGTLGDTNYTLSQLAQQLGQISPDALQQSLTQAKANGASTDSGLQASLLQQQLTEAQQTNLLLSREMSAFGLPPFAGTFHAGGIIPGPVGAERMALVQAGERINAIGDDGGSIAEHRFVAEAKGALADLIDMRIEHRTRRAARNAGRGLAGAGGGRF